MHADNRGMRAAMQRRLPLVYFHGVVEGKYLASWPVFVVADDPVSQTFSIAVDDASHMGLAGIMTATGDEAETSDVRIRPRLFAFGCTSERFAKEC
jgi:hypothetical protein